MRTLPFLTASTPQPSTELSSNYVSAIVFSLATLRYATLLYALSSFDNSVRLHYALASLATLRLCPTAIQCLATYFN